MTTIMRLMEFRRYKNRKRGLYLFCLHVMFVGNVLAYSLLTIRLLALCHIIKL